MGHYKPRLACGAGYSLLFVTVKNIRFSSCSAHNPATRQQDVAESETWAMDGECANVSSKSCQWQVLLVKRLRRHTPTYIRTFRKSYVRNPEQITSYILHHMPHASQMSHFVKMSCLYAKKEHWPSQCSFGLGCINLQWAVRTGIEPVFPPWEGGVLTAWPTNRVL